jgi:hypothetical protein
MLRVLSVLVYLAVAVHAAPAALEARGGQEPDVSANPILTEHQMCRQVSSRT